MQQHAFSARLDRHPEGLSPLRERLRSWLTDVGVQPGDREEIVLACWEAAANALEHPILEGDAAAEVQIVAVEEDGHILVSVADAGRWRLREAPREGGADAAGGAEDENVTGHPDSFNWGMGVGASDGRAPPHG